MALEALKQLEQTAPLPTSIEVEARPVDEEIVLPEQSMRSQLGVVDNPPSYIERGLSVLYGNDFPLISNDNPDEEDWVRWGRSLWDRHREGVQRRLHMVERNRLFRKGIQWISSVGNSGWREPPKPKDAARVVYNMLAPALDQRVQIISEQRPGFKARPSTQDPDDVKKAEAKQQALEYQWDQQNMIEITREAAYWAGTDSVTFLELYWDTEAGPWHEAYGADAQGQQQPLGPDGAPAQQPHKFPLGDVKTRVRKIEQIRVSANATATNKPWYWIIRDVMSHAEAVRLYGLELSESKEASFAHEDSMQSGPSQRLGYLLPDESELLEDQEKIDRYTVYCERSSYLERGLMLVIVGDKVVHMSPLLPGVVPIVRWTDGTTDPSWLSIAVMENWLDSQMRFNAVLSKWVENVRLNSGTKLIAKPQSVVKETLIGSTMTVIEAKGLGPISDIIRPLEAFSLAPDAINLLQLEAKHFEDLSGWNDTSRGMFSSEQSGRAILAIREQLERIFAPGVMAAARAMTEWAKIACAWMKWGYDIPRMIGVEGKGRPDLARAISSDDMDGTTDVWIDPETLMPLPRALRLQLLDDLYAKQIIPPQEYRRRLPFAFVRDLDYPDQAHIARARRVVEFLRQGQWLPILPMDDEFVHKDVLERELLLQDDTPQEIRAMAFERWMQLSQQQQMKAAGMLPLGTPAFPPPPGAPASGAGASGSPATQPLAGTNPGGGAAGTMSTLGGETDQTRAGREFDQRMRRQGNA